MPRFGRYETLEEIGRGAMGIVYRARDPQIDRIVALKTLSPPAGATAEDFEELRQRFGREVRMAGQLVHPHIVQVYDTGEDFIAMELVDGVTLDRLMDRGPMPEREALNVLEQIAQALDFAHERGIVHRDVKPSNILVARNGMAKVMDFGIAKVLGSTVTTMKVMGTPRYMSPEQISGGVVSAVSDNFALAEIAYELLTGEKAFPGETVAGILYRIVHEDPIAPSRANRALPRRLDPVFAKSLAKGPAHRYSRALDFVHDIRRSLEGGDSLPTETQSGEILKTSRRELLAAVARVTLIPPAVVALAVATLLLFMPEARLIARDLMARPEVEHSENPTPSPTAPRPASSKPEAPPNAPPTVLPPSTPEPEVKGTEAPSPVPPRPIEASPPVGTRKAPAPSPPAPSPSFARRDLFGLRFLPTAIPGLAGAPVVSVSSGSAAGRAGLRPRDIITSWQGVAVDSPSDLAGLDRAGSSQVEVEYLREEDGALEARRTTIVLHAAGPDRRVSVASVRLEHGTAEGAGRGVTVLVGLEASGFSGRKIVVGVRFQEFAGDGIRPMVSAEGSPVERSATFRPEVDTWVSGPIPIFVPYDLLAGPGERSLRAQVIVEDDAGQELARHVSTPFLVSAGGTSAPTR